MDDDLIGSTVYSGSAASGPTYWERQAELAKLPLSDRLLRAADVEEQAARQFNGVSWMGDVHPSTPHMDTASLLRQAAAELKRHGK